MAWIKIKKGGKKPTKGENVIVCNASNGWVVSGYWTGKKWYNQFEVPKFEPEIFPTHWQPLPEPPNQTT